MKKMVLGVIISLAAACAFLALGTARADAATEYCPATFEDQRPLDGKDAATLYSFALTAQSARTLADTDVVVLTESGWYDVTVPSATLSERDQRWRDPNLEFTRKTFQSQPLYVRFPKALRIVAGFVRHTTVHDESVFGWSARGPVTCQARAGFPVAADEATPQPKPSSDPFPITLENPRTDLDALPGPGAPVTAAVQTNVPGDTSCPKPSVAASVVRAAPARFPFGYAARGIIDAMILVSVDDDGKLADASVYTPTGSSAFDDAALESAKGSTYRAGTSFCAPAPGQYFFRVEYRPD